MRVKLGDVCASIYDGDHSAPPKSKSGIPFITISNINAGDGFIDFSNTAFVPEEYCKSLKVERKPKRGDVLYSVVGSFGIPSLIKSDEKFVFQRHIAILRPNERIDSTYLYYVLKDPNFYHWADAVAIGSAQRTVTLGQLRNKEIDLPDLETQRRIAGVLSAYDELIENNRKQIKLLEEAAQRLYKDWFVDLNFPGHETTSIHNGLPDGWKRICLGELLSSHIGGGWGKDTCDADYSVGALVVRATDIEDIRNGITSNVPLRWHLKSNYSSRHLEVGDIVFEVSGGSKEKGVGRSLLVTNEYLALLGAPTICASFCKRMHLETYTDSLYLYWTIQHDLALGAIRKYEKSSAGNIINFLWKEFLESYEIALPNEETRLAFEATAGPLTTGIGECSQQVSAAREARDRLLPRLISGEIEG